jgi:hypothetical protein
MLDELQLTYTSYNGQNLNSPAVSVIRGSTVFKESGWENHKRPDEEYENKKSIKARISSSIDGKENINIVRSCSKLVLQARPEGGRGRGRGRGRPRVEWEEYVE